MKLFLVRRQHNSSSSITTRRL
jgi:protein-serine/threonine kinase